VARNFAQKTYDVFVLEDDRWLIDSHHEVRSPALERAEELLAEKRFAGVRIISESQRTGEEEILFEEVLEVGDKPVQIVPIDDAPVCGGIGDYYQFPARQAAGRLLRELLDQKGQTALELAFDYGALRLLERNDTFFPQAMQRVGAIHARKTGEKPAARNDMLYAAFGQIKENARVAGEDSQRIGFLERLDLKGLVAKAPKGDPVLRRIYVLGGLALALQQRGDWSDKVALVIELAEKAEDALVTEFLDEIAAEILDSNMAITELFGGFADPISAFRALVQVTQGRCRINNPRSCLTAFNDLMAHRPMPRTKSVLTGRVARSLGGIRPMTREGPDAEMDAFKSFVRELTTAAGLNGGARMAEAVAKRSQIIFADPDDLPIEEALGRVLALLPNRAVRLGYLLDVIASPLGNKNEQAVLNVLSRLVTQLKSLTSLIPDGMTKEDVDAVLAELREKMAADALPEKWRILFSKTLDRLVERGEDPADNAGTSLIFKMEDAPVKTNKDVERREAKAGDLLFEEGDPGSEAYLILDGKVDVFRKSGNEEIVLATLGRGDIIGEMSLIDNQPRMASARARADAKLTVITQGDLEQRLGKLGDNDKVLRRIIDVFVERLRGQARSFE